MRYAVNIDIDRPADEVFSFLSDLRNELRWNPAAKSVEKLTAGPVARRTRFGATWRRAPPAVVELVEYDPPRTWTTRSRSLGMEVTFRGSLAPTAAGTHYTADVSVEPHGLGWLIAPLAIRTMQRQEAANLGRIKGVLERAASAPRAVQKGVS